MNMLAALLGFCVGFGTCLLCIMLLAMFQSVNRAEEDIKEKSQRNIKEPI